MGGEGVEEECEMYVNQGLHEVEKNKDSIVSFCCCCFVVEKSILKVFEQRKCDVWREKKKKYEK